MNQPLWRISNNVYNENIQKLYNTIQEKEWEKKETK